MRNDREEGKCNKTRECVVNPTIFDATSLQHCVILCFCSFAREQQCWRKFSCYENIFTTIKIKQVLFRKFRFLELEIFDLDIKVEFNFMRKCFINRILENFSRNIFICHQYNDKKNLCGKFVVVVVLCSLCIQSLERKKCHCAKTLRRYLFFSSLCTYIFYRRS